ncbi:hypothetical protein Tel_04920 [Candidatus Tenderia electrophaga]|jgi:four helix bundle protein|uniref:Four helix bundle protein n=1 Tax=Candidatus Tenderia electrophaga TaxID=1748243 RepID=A0A0S2TBK7_9GAMM|nr:hypothetical protein Tel_04920 [Candidatus Tenderia electrophaga]
MNEYRFEEEETWKLARELAWDVYSITNRGAFAGDHRVRNSVRRASFAIMANIAEGVERGGTLEFVRYLSDAKDEVEELHHQLQQAEQKGFITEVARTRLDQTLESLGCMISGLMTSINQEFLNSGSVSVDYQVV